MSMKTIKNVFLQLHSQTEADLHALGPYVCLPLH